VNSASKDIWGLTGVWVHVYVESTGAPTDVRIIAQFSHNNGANWANFEEGLWASLYWEDTDTAAGILRAFFLPCAGQDFLRFRVVTTGTGALATFTVGIRARGFRGPPVAAHA
jgi:hypothetical protein